MRKAQTAAESLTLAQRAFRGVLRILRLVAVCYLVICLMMMFLETRLVYPIPKVESAGQVLFDENSEDVEFRSKDGTKLHGRYYPNDNAKAVILYCHGNGEDVSRNDSHIAYLRNRLSASIFIFDYRGYGRSQGSPVEAGVIEDGLAAQRWLAEQTNLATEDTVLYGRSLGGGVAVAIANQQGARALILHSTFPNMPDVAAAHYPWLPVRWLMRNRFPSTERIQHFKGPVIQLHGTADEVVPLAKGRQLFEAAPSEQKRFIEIPNGTHNSPLPGKYVQEIVYFLESIH